MINHIVFYSETNLISEPFDLTLVSQCALETIKSDLLLKNFYLIQTAKAEVGAITVTKSRRQSKFYVVVKLFLTHIINLYSVHIYKLGPNDRNQNYGHYLSNSQCSQSHVPMYLSF